jgi:hypothetical protein
MKVKQSFIFFSLLIFFASLNWTCKKDAAIPHLYKTKNVIIVVVDGARYTETWSLPSHPFIPNRSGLLDKGVLCSNFYNNGYTFTNAGHTAMCTGVYQFINNSGSEYPQYPSIFQYWLRDKRKSSDKAWIVTSKDKLAILADCQDPEWQGKYKPNTDCGNSGLGSGYRLDSITFNRAKNILTTNHPGLMLINFKEPDMSAHANDSVAYLKGIMDTDYYVRLIWELIQNDNTYKDQTTLIVTNDHGRHTAGHLDGFISHSDNCEGCRHIEFFAIGPDFKRNYIISKPYEQVDIANTISELLDLNMLTAKGKVIKDIFK